MKTYSNRGDLRKYETKCVSCSKHMRDYMPVTVCKPCVIKKMQKLMLNIKEI